LSTHACGTGAVTFFSNTLNTHCYKTIEDTLLTVKQYEDARYAHDSLVVADLATDLPLTMNTYV